MASGKKSQRHDDLVLARQRVIDAMDVANTLELVSLSRELRAINLELAELESPGKGDSIDELSQKRKARQAAVRRSNADTEGGTG